MKSVLQDWVMELGLRHQGVLISAIRGCDTEYRDSASKKFVRIYRGLVLNCFCGDPNKAVSYIQPYDDRLITDYFDEFKKNFDHYPIHYFLHLLHAIEIISYKHPDKEIKYKFQHFYRILCNKMHINCESEEQLDFRLNADEETFKKLQG